FLSPALAASLGPAAVAQQQTVIDFNDLNLDADSFYNGGPSTNTDGWSSGGAFFSSSFTDGGSFTFWSGASYSNINNPTTPGPGNQYAAFPGVDATADTPADSGIYAVLDPTGSSYINLPAGQSIESLRATNTTYAALSMRDGDPFAKAFGGATGDDPDFFTVTFTGRDGVNGGGNVTGEVEFVLADFRFADNTQDYIVDEWELVGLSALGDARSITLSFDSSDVGQFGINTPTYVAIDDLVVVPEPTAAGLLLGSAALLRRRRRN
ncbi:MAG: DUF4465 domain-containing protein, partial [Planctomycetota bacterium]